MKCELAQNQILMLPDPRELTPALREHVTACEACQVWARQAARIETVLEHLPAPPAPELKKEAMLGDLMQAEPVIHAMPAGGQGPGFGLGAARFLRRNATYVGSLAAAVLIVVGIYAFWPRTATTPELVKTEKYPFLQNVVSHNAALSRAKTPTERLHHLNGLADTIATNTRDVARIAPAPKLKEMAGLYDKTVKEGVKQAGKLPLDLDAAEKAKLLDSYAAKLSADAAAAESLSREVPPDAQPALKQMADSARDAEKSLRAARGATSSAVAQAPAPAQTSLTAEDKIRLLETNSALISNLVNEGIALANADTQVKRVETCRNSSLALVNAIGQAADAQNAERVAELTGLFQSFVKEGLAPILEEARREVPPQSPDGKRLRELHGDAANDLARLKTEIGKSDKVSQNQRVKEALKSLDELTDALKS